MSQAPRTRKGFIVLAVKELAALLGPPCLSQVFSLITGTLKEDTNESFWDLGIPGNFLWPFHTYLCLRNMSCDKKFSFIYIEKKLSSQFKV